MAVSFFGLALMALIVLGGIIGALALIWAVSNRGASSERRGEESRKESHQVQELVALSERLESRIEALETLLMESSKKGSRSRSEDRYRDE